MKRLTILILCLLVLVGCDNKKREVSNTNTNTNTNSNIENSNSNSYGDENDPAVGTYTVHLYLFHSNTCEHCKEEIEWLKSIENDYSYLKIHYYEASENQKLYEKVKDIMKIDSPYVPLTIIGEDWYIGFASSKERKFIRTINEYSKEDFCDVVGTIINGGDVNACMEKNKRS